MKRVVLVFVILLLLCCCCSPVVQQGCCPYLSTLCCKSMSPPTKLHQKFCETQSWTNLALITCDVMSRFFLMSKKSSWTLENCLIYYTSLCLLLQLALCVTLVYIVCKQGEHPKRNATPGGTILIPAGTILTGSTHTPMPHYSSP